MTSDSAVAPTVVEGDLRRAIKLPQLFSMAFASMIGVGWITLLGMWLQEAGPIGSIIGFAGGFVVVILIVLAYSEVSTMFPVAGAEVAYAQVAFRSAGAFAVAWVLLALYVSVIAFEIISVGWIMTVVAPSLKGVPVYHALGADVYSGELLIGLGVMAAVTYANLMGASMAAQVQFVLLVLKIVVSLLFITAGFWAGNVDYLEPGIVLQAGDRPWAGVFTIFSMSLLFYGGFNYLPQALEERDRSVSPRQICLAMVFSVLAAFIFYAAVILSASLVLPREQILGQDLPTAAAFEAAFGSVHLRNLVLLAGFLGIVTAMNGTIFAASRIILMMSRIKLLPPALGAINPRLGTPVVAIAIIATIGTIGAGFGRGAIGILVTSGAATIPFTWGLVSLVALRLRRTQPQAPRPFRVRYGQLIFSLAFLSSLFALGVSINDAFLAGKSGLSPEAITLLVILGVGLAVWLATAKLRRSMSEDERRRLIESEG